MSMVYIDIKNLGEYQNHNNMLDVIQLIDTEINFSKDIHKRFNLEPFYFVTLTSLSWDAALRKTKTELELLTDVNMILFSKKGIRAAIIKIICHYPVKPIISTCLIMIKQKKSMY